MDRMERLKSHVVEDEKGCWIWQGAMDGETPIVKLSQPRRITPARRHAYEVHNEVDVPDTHVIKNACGVKRCINPWHASACLRGTHVRWLTGFSRPEYCQRGHEWTEWNTMPQSLARGGRLCRACHNIRNRAQVVTRKSERAAYTKKHVSTKLALVASMKVKCSRCEESDPCCLDFHHREPSDKEVSVAFAARNYSIKRILAEIAKCDVLCSNCHRKLHREQRRQSEAG